MNPPRGPNGSGDDPLVRLGQSEYRRDLYPHDFDDPPKPNEGGSVALLVIALFYFVLGLLIGAWLW